MKSKWESRFDEKIQLKIARQMAQQRERIGF